MNAAPGEFSSLSEQQDEPVTQTAALWALIGNLLLVFFGGLVHNNEPFVAAFVRFLALRASLKPNVNAFHYCRTFIILDKSNFYFCTASASTAESD